MPRITTTGASNADIERDDKDELIRQGRLLPREEESRAGTSSSASESKPDKSGPSGTQDHRSPAQDAESPSKQDQPRSAAQSSTAPSTSGNTRVTGSGQQNQPDSSAGSAAAKGRTAGQGRDKK